MVTAVMIRSAVLLYRDDTGRTVAEKLALRSGCLPSGDVQRSHLSS